MEATVQRTFTSRALDPMSILLLMAASYVTLLLWPDLPYFDETAFFSGASIVGYLPTTKTLLVFLGGIALLAATYWLISRHVVRPDLHARAVTPRTIWIIGSLYAFSVGTNIAAFIDIGSLPLFDIATRQLLSARLVWVASWQITLVPAAMIVLGSQLRDRNFWLVSAGLAVTSLGLLALLGTRSVPLKLVVALAVTVGLLAKVRWRHLLALFLVGLVVFVVIGAVSKSQVYAGDRSAVSHLEKAVNQAYLDSVGMFFRLDILVAESDKNGAFGLYDGQLFADTALNIVPGIDRQYANYVVGELVAANEVAYVAAWNARDVPPDGTDPEVQGTDAEDSGSLAPPSSAPGRLVDLGDVPISQAPTIVGAAYADFGLAGVAFQMLTVGGLMGTLLRIGVREPLLLAFLASLTGHVAAGLNLGLHGEHAILLGAASAVAVGVAAYRAHVRSVHGLEIEEEEEEEEEVAIA